MTALLTLGGLAAGTAVASAGQVGTCSASGILATCAVSGAPVHPVTITAAVTASPMRAFARWLRALAARADHPFQQCSNWLDL